MELRKWWKETGSRLVNKELIDLVGENIGYVPLRNLFEDICDIPTKKLEEILSDLARNTAEFAADRIRAIDTLNKMTGEYINRTELSGDLGVVIVDDVK